jgi:hypothetical protein
MSAREAYWPSVLRERQCVSAPKDGSAYVWATSVYSGGWR